VIIRDSSDWFFGMEYNALYMPQKEHPSNATVAPSRSQPDDPAEVRVVLLSDEEIPTAALVGRRLWHVRQLYALSFLLRVPVLRNIDVIPVAALLFRTDEDSDLEELVPFKLQIRSAGTGTFWVDIFLQMVPHLPSGADLKQWADWLKNAQSAIVAVASLCSVLITYGKKLSLTGKKPADVKQKTNASNDAFNDIMKRIAELKDVSEDDKEQIRSAFAHNLEGILGSRWRELLQGLPPVSRTPGNA